MLSVRWLGVFIAVSAAVWISSSTAGRAEEAGRRAMLVPGGGNDRLSDGAGREPVVPPNVIRVVGAKLDLADRIYFQRCAGCHGAERQGGTGKPLTLAVTRKLGFEKLHDTINNGTSKGMPNWGTSGELSADEVKLMAKYLLEKPTRPPGFDLTEIRASWKVHVPLSDRPEKQLTSFKLHEKLSVVPLENGRIALNDATDKTTVTVIETGREAIRGRLSASSRYLYTLDCDAKVTLFDLWMAPPTPVAEVKIGAEGRSIEPSRKKSPAKLSLLAASNWPPQYVALDGKTLEPKLVHQFQDFGKVRAGCGEDED